MTTAPSDGPSGDPLHRDALPDGRLDVVPDTGLRRLVFHLPETIVEYDLAGRIVFANEAFHERTGRTLDEVFGCRPFGWTSEQDLVPDVEEYRRLLDLTLETGDSHEMTRTRPDGSGSYEIYQVQFRPEFADDGRVAGAFALAHNISELAHARQAIADREHEFRSLAENLPDIVVRYDTDARVTYVNRPQDLPGSPDRSEIIGRTPADPGDPRPPDAEGFERSLRRVLATGASESVTMTFDVDGPDGLEQRVHDVSIRAEHDTTGRVCGAIAIGRDVTDLVRAQHDVARREQQFRTLAENATDFIGRWDLEGRCVYVNPALAALMGGVAGDIVDDHAAETGRYPVISGAIRATIADARHRTALERFVDLSNGDEHIHDVQLIPEFDADGSFVSVLVVGRDITEVVRQGEALELSARTDALTGVSSRQVLYERLPRMIEERRDAAGRIAVLLLDLDGFKHINDQYGHRLGDRILRGVGRRLAECIGPDDLLVRVGGDEFVLVLAHVDSPTDAALLAHQARLGLTALDLEDDTRYPAFDASVGIAIFPDHGDDVDALLAHADLALYDAKRAGRGRVEFFRTELREAMERRGAIEQALRTCVPDTEMALHLQPICTIGPDPQVWGVEALLRWTHPTLGRVTPDEFIPIAEQSGQIVPIGRWVLRRAAEIAADLNRGRARPLRIAVNVSTRQFTLDDISDAVHEALTATGCDPRWMIVEITESLMLEDLPLVNGALDSLRNLGVAIAIDDFGTGYSALQYLTRLRVDHMKVDKSFVRDADVDRQQQEIVRALVAMAQALGIEVVAEGIETHGQAALLEQLGCRLGQGYLLAAPMPFTDLTEWLATASARLRHALPA